MARVLWPHQEAEKILKRHGDRPDPVVFETGYGPSGLPHIGTFAENARTSFVLESLKALRPDLPLKLIVFSDDMDGLRSLPENVPNHALLKKHLGAPLTKIPDPFGEEISYAHFMNKQLKKFLDSFGFSYEFLSSTECYESGRFDEGLRQVMRHYAQIKAVFVREISEEKRESWSPFFPICENCGKNTPTRVTEIFPEQDRLSYECCGEDGVALDEVGSSAPPSAACGHKGTISILGGTCKVGWKVDWALRWFVLGVDYEMHGKDLIDSAKMSARICRILGGTPPLNYKFELFNDEAGRKISKKKGNGISMEQWMAYSPLGALLNFLLLNPNKSRQMGLPILPRIVDDFFVAIQQGTADEALTVSWFLRKFHPKEGIVLPKPPKHLTFSLLVNVAESLGLQDGAMLFHYAEKHEPQLDQDFFHALCHQVVDYVQGLEKTPPATAPDLAFYPTLFHVRAQLEAFEASTFHGDAVQKALFQITKDHDLPQRKFFAFLYSVLLQKDHGPKLGPFFSMLGKAESLKMIDQAIEAHRPSTKL